jgi:hypothetical protein
VPDDAAITADLMSSAYPEMPEDPVMLRYRWENPRQEMLFGRFIAEMSGRPRLPGPWAGSGDQAHLARAVELAPTVITDNDSENVAMQRTNEKLGYRLRPGFVGHLKRVSKS